jgi:hypothetical protein
MDGAYAGNEFDNNNIIKSQPKTPFNLLVGRFPDGNFTAILTVPGPGGGAVAVVYSAAAAATAASNRACLEAAACWRCSSSRAILAASSAAAWRKRYQINAAKRYQKIRSTRENRDWLV